MSNIDNIALAVPCINQSQQTRVLTANIHGSGGGEGVGWRRSIRLATPIIWVQAKMPHPSRHVVECH